MPTLARARPAMGVRQEPSSAARKARSQVTAAKVSASLMAARRSLTKALSMRLSMQIAPCAGAGGSARVEQFRHHLRLVEAAKTRIGEQRRIHLPLGKLAQARIDQAAIGDDLDIGLRLRMRACRRREEEPMTAPCGSSISVCAVRPMKASRTSSRGR